ncbi:MAG: pyridoxal-phosphate dependent enzyme [bacterium]|nr:pyridoxal-phosphate dependent enzyme [bacterium]
MVTITHIRAAADRIRDHIHRTPVLTGRSVDAWAGCRVFFKCENLQRVGAFKMRGASNAVFSLTDHEAARGVATHSSGNHAQALALAAKLRGVPAHVVMPTSAPAVKKRAVAGYGAVIHDCEPTLAARESTLERVVAETGAAFIHPYDDERVIAGQGTAALELLEEVPDLDLVVTPVGGGGLLSGTALTVAALAPRARVFAAEPTGADDAARSLAAGEIIPSVAPDTVCDGLLSSLGQRTFPIIREHVKGIWTVDDDATLAALRMIWERLKIVVEPSGAIPLAAVRANPAVTSGKRVGVILSGGNIDLEKLPWV